MDFNGRVVGIAIALTMLTAVIFGLVPALRATQPDLVTGLKEEARSTGPSRSWLRSALVVSQVALSLVTLVCAGLFVRSLRAASTVDLGFQDPAHVLLATTDLNLARLDEANGLVATERVLERVRTLPGVTAAAFSTMVPLGFGGHSSSGTSIEGYTPLAEERLSIERIIVSAGYFETMGIPIARGRGIGAQDRRGGQRVVVINEAFGRRYWPGLDPIGRRLDQGPGWATVVGVARDSKYAELGETPYPVVYSALPQRFEPVLVLHVRTVLAPAALAEAVRREFLAVNAGLPFLDPRTLRQHIGSSTFITFIGATMLTGFGALALLLAAIGLYGVLACTVSHRQREIGVRVALGASTRDVLALILGGGLRLTLIGLVLGTVPAFVAGRLLRAQLLNISPTDPLTFALVVVLLGAVAMLACWFPARRAAKVDPMIALRSE